MASITQVVESISSRGGFKPAFVSQIARRCREDGLLPTTSGPVPANVSAENLAHLILAVATSSVIADAPRNALTFGNLSAGQTTLLQAMAENIKNARGGDSPHSRFFDLRLDLAEPSATAIERIADAIATSDFTDNKAVHRHGKVQARRVVELPHEFLLYVAVDFKNAK